MSNLGKVCYTALFGNYEDLKEPTVVTPGWRYICFTDQPIVSKVWEVVRRDVFTEPRRTARWFKIMGWIDWDQSMWVDASFQINVDLNKWWDDHFKLPFSCAAHPLRNDIYDECRNCIANNRGEALLIEKQCLKYRAMGFPANKGIIQSGIMLRENTAENVALHEAWWKELDANSTRDQIAFAFVSLNSNIVSTYKWDYSQSKEFKYIKHYHLRH